MNKLTLILPLTAALITACGGTSAPSNFKQPASITGTIQNYSGGASTIEALAVGTSGKSASNPVIASAALNANGSFTLPLPPVATITPYLSAPASAADAVYTETGCSGQLTNSAPDAQAYAISALNAGGVTYTNVTTTTNQTARTVTVDGGEWIYTTKATTLGGNLICTGSASGITEVLEVSFNAPLKAGWNFLKLHADGVASSDNATLTVNLNFATADDQATSWTSASASPLSVNPLARVVTASLGSVHIGNLHF